MTSLWSEHSDDDDDDDDDDYGYVYDINSYRLYASGGEGSLGFPDL